MSKNAGLSGNSTGNSISNCFESKGSSLSELAAEFQNSKQLEEMRKEILRSSILGRVKEATKLMNSPSDSSKVSSEHAPVERMNWDQLYEVSASAMDIYTKEVDDVLSELDRFYRKQYLWQESAFTIDSHRGASRIGVAEEWMKAKESHLEFMVQEFTKSAQVIKKTIEGLSHS